MIRQNQRFLTQIYVVSDLLCTLLTFLTSFWLKFNSGFLPHQTTLPFQTYLIWATIYSFAAVLIGFYVRFYVPRRRKKASYEVMKVVQVQGLSFLGLLSLLFIAKEVHISREFLAIFLVANIACLSFYRLTVKSVLFRIRRRGYNKRYLLILGAGSVGRSFHDNITQQPGLGYDVIGFLDDFQVKHEAEHHHYKPILGAVDELEVMLSRHTVDEVIIALPLKAHKKYAHIIDKCERTGVKTLIIPDFFDLLPARPFFDNFAGIPLINVRDIPLDELSNQLLKRMFDIVFSILIILLTSPVMLVAYLGIKLTSAGPVIFRQERVGLDRRTFQMYKFRSMHVFDRETADTQWTIENDPRRTRFGSFLRKTSIDELPQFFNVLAGHMSVVGPRPERPYFVEQFKEEIPKYMIKHHIRPGITGWAQTNGLRGDTSIEDRIVHDLFYMENWTFFFDLQIIARTVTKGLLNKNAY
ncbi:undecaprenyl-phosphate glucose phosphotransferase [Paenibacillus sp. R14(2021)]|uniref:undecaprenyl-phosphate glucose phosphotransferase n=1 Tax=Paenibacillus sp. R14(2021) TaxID=2859228 RepID=UPI001C6153B5|nr:undecaprenyl-phosphate glucose phosphotransferase [Paenibacillus sp. R14(2021)]